MKFNRLPIPGVITIEPHPLLDNRGSFMRVFCKNEFQEQGIESEFVQINQSYNKLKGTFRGFHYQVPPHAERKLIRCIAGGVIDIVIDLRRSSPTFLQHLFVEITAENGHMIFIPEGVAHGFISLHDNTKLLYHHTAFYQPGSERGIRFDDPRIDIKLPFEPMVLSDKDRQYPLLPDDFSGIDMGDTPRNEHK